MKDKAARKLVSRATKSEEQGDYSTSIEATFDAAWELILGIYSPLCEEWPGTDLCDDGRLWSPEGTQLRERMKQTLRLVKIRLNRACACSLNGDALLSTYKLPEGVGDLAWIGKEYSRRREIEQRVESSGFSYILDGLGQAVELSVKGLKGAIPPARKKKPGNKICDSL